MKREFITRVNLTCIDQHQSTEERDLLLTKLQRTYIMSKVKHCCD